MGYFFQLLGIKVYNTNLTYKIFMKNYLLLALVAIFCFYGCEKEELVQLDDKGETNSAFFKHTKSGDEFSNFIISSLSHADDSIAFTGNFVDTYGIPKWGAGFSINAKERNSLIIPILDEDNQIISALYYLKYKNNYIETYILMNDEDDIAYDETKHLIQFFETKLGLEKSNKDFEIIEKSGLKYSSMDYETCYSWWQVSTFSDGTVILKHESECSTETEVIFDGYTSGGGWANSGGGNYPPNGSYSGGGAGTDTGNTNPLLEPIPEVIPTLKFRLSKAGCVFTKMDSNGGFLNLLDDFSNKKTGLDLMLDVKKDLTDKNGNNVNGLAISDELFKLIRVQIDEDYQNNSTPLEVAKTLLHEAIHAYMYAAIIKSDNSLTRLKDDYFGIWDYYVRFRYGEEGSFQHNLMAAHYVNIMATSLSKFDGNRFELKHYEALSWKGLKRTRVWVDKTPSEKTSIEDLVKTLLDNRSIVCNK